MMILQSKFLLVILFISSLFLLTACGSESSSSTECTPTTEGSTDSFNKKGLNGLITLVEYDVISDIVGIMSFKLTEGNSSSGVTVAANGESPYRHPEGKVLFVQHCKGSRL